MHIDAMNRKKKWRAKIMNQYKSSFKHDTFN